MVPWFEVGQEALGISFLSPSSKQMVGLAMIKVDQPIKKQHFCFVKTFTNPLPDRTPVRRAKTIIGRRSVQFSSWSSKPRTLLQVSQCKFSKWERKCALLFGLKLSYCQLLGGQLMQQVLFSCSTVCSFFATVAIPRSVLES